MFRLLGSLEKPYCWQQNENPISGEIYPDVFCWVKKSQLGGRSAYSADGRIGDNPNGRGRNGTLTSVTVLVSRSVGTLWKTEATLAMNQLEKLFTMLFTVSV